MESGRTPEARRAATYGWALSLAGPRGVFACLLLSGFSGLVYEVVWLRLAMAAFGATTPITAWIFSVFLGGLGLGGWWVGRWLRRAEPGSAGGILRGYALVELLVACASVAVPVMLRAGHARLAAGGGAALGWWTGGMIAAALLPWCVLMGCTVPMGMAALRRMEAGGDATRFSFLYLANVIGAVLGTLLSAFVFIEWLGFRGTSAVAAGVNLLAAGLAVWLSRRAVSVPWSPTPPAVSAVPASSSYLMWLFLTGFTSMAMEVVWIRQFTPFMGTDVYAVAWVLACYLVATVGGTWWYRSGIHRAGFVRWGWAAVSVLGVWPLMMASPFLPEGYAAVRVAAGVMPFSLALGWLTPWLVDEWSGGDAGRAGRAYAVNMAGCVLGPLAASFVVLPMGGDKWGLVGLTVPLIAMAWWSLRKEPSSASRWGWGVALASAGLVVVTAKAYEDQFPSAQVRRDHTATVIAAADAHQVKYLLVNGQGMTKLTPIPKMMAHLPLAFLDRDPKKGLVICFGMGTTFRSMLAWGVETTAVELVPSVPELFSFYHADAAHWLGHPKAKVVIDDGRRYLEYAADTFDVITIDPPPPVYAAGSSLLYSKEFYAAAKKRLAPDGILQQWVTEADPAIVASIAKALKASFRHVRVFRAYWDYGFHLLASDQAWPARTAVQLADRLPSSAMRDIVEMGPTKRPRDQFQILLEQEVPIRALMAPGSAIPVLEDDRPVNEYFLLRQLRAAFSK